MIEHLYPTLIADSSLTTPAADNCSTLQRQITSEIVNTSKKLQRSMKEMIITIMGGTWLLIHQAHNKKPISENRTMIQAVMKKIIKQLYRSLMGKTPGHTTEVLKDATSNLRMS